MLFIRAFNGLKDIARADEFPETTCWSLPITHGEHILERHGQRNANTEHYHRREGREREYRNIK